jgi:hypothetical protein
MKNSVSILLFAAFVLISIGANGQTVQCDTLHEFPEKAATFKESGFEALQFFNENLLEIICNSTSSDFPPTSFKMILVINDKDEVESISEIRGDYSEETKNKILERLKNEKGWRSGESNGQKVCSKYYFTVGCILWD